MNLISQTSIFMNWMYYNKIHAVSWFRAHNSLIRSEFWVHNGLIRNDSERKIVWTMVWVWSGPWSYNRLDNGLILVWSEDLSVWKGPFRLERSEQKQFRAHPEQTLCFERTLAWSEDTLFWDGLIRGYFRLARSDQRSLPDGTSTWEILKFAGQHSKWCISKFFCRSWRWGSLQLKFTFTVSSQRWLFALFSGFSKIFDNKFTVIVKTHTK